MAKIEDIAPVIDATINRTGRAGLTEPELARLLGLNRLTLIRARQAKRLPFCRLGGGLKILYLKSHILQYLKNCEQITSR